MLNLAERYWSWRNKPKPPKIFFNTEDGHKVRKFGERWAVVAKHGYKKDAYCDLKGDHAWVQGDSWFKDCLGEREEIEDRFGKILDEE